MANDRPTSLRMGFGFQQARAAGAPYVPPGSPFSYNWSLKERQAQRELRKMAEADPSVEASLLEMIQNPPTVYLGGIAVKIQSAQMMLWKLQGQFEETDTFSEVEFSL